MNNLTRISIVAFLSALVLGPTPSVHAADEAAKSSETPPSAIPAALAENSVVKIFSTVRGPDLVKPWGKQSPREISGSGVVIEGNRILTNAHVLLYATQVQVQANQSGDKMPARVEAIAPGIDLAVLKLEDESFFASHPPLPRSTSLPTVKDTVVVYGFATGGSSLSITKGIVSRIEFAAYGYPVSGLRIQIDAAINPGNSGGPALVDDRMIGLAYSRLGGADNIGYIIPSEEVDLFLQDIADGRYDGKPLFVDSLQSLENPSLRAFLKLDRKLEGVVVSDPDDDSPASPLKPWDVITHIGDVPIDNQGMIRIGPNLRVRFAYQVQKSAKDEKLPLRIVREGREMQVEVPAPLKRPLLIPNLEGTYPPYFICGPLVLSNANSVLTGSIGGNARASSALSARSSPLVTRRGDKPAFEGEELVVVASPFLPHKLTKGYGNPFARVIRKINEVTVKNLRHAVEIMRDAKGEFIVFQFEQHGGESLIFPREEMLSSTEEILSDNGIRSQGSEDLMAVWKAGAKKP